MDSETYDFGGPVHYLRYPAQGGAGGRRPPFLLVHGLGGSHVNWTALAPLLARTGDVFAVDLVGHGRTPPAGRVSSLGVNAELVSRFLDDVVGGPGVLVGNSMGGLVSMIVTAAHPERVAALVLVDPSLPWARGQRLDLEIGRNFAAYAIPGMGERFLRQRRARLGPKGMVAETLRYCTVDPRRVPATAIAAAVDFAEERAALPYGDVSFMEAARSLLRFHATRRSLDLIRRFPDTPTLLLHGAKDRLVPLTAARQTARLRPDWTLEVLDDIGHIPQLEAPDLIATTITHWLPTATASPARQHRRRRTISAC